MIIAHGLAVLQVAWHEHSCKDLLKHICWYVLCAGFLLEGTGSMPLEICPSHNTHTHNGNRLICVLYSETT